MEMLLEGNIKEAKGNEFFPPVCLVTRFIFTLSCWKTLEGCFSGLQLFSWRSTLSLVRGFEFEFDKCGTHPHPNQGSLGFFNFVNGWEAPRLPRVLIMIWMRL
jgi:hypothetical protein